MIDQSRTPAVNAEQRRHTARHKMFGPVTLRTGGIEMRGHFLDLSTAGALAHCETSLTPGAYVTVEAIGMEASGRVMWAQGKRFGIQFSQPLADDAMERLIRGA